MLPSWWKSAKFLIINSNERLIFNCTAAMFSYESLYYDKLVCIRVECVMIFVYVRFWR